MEHLEAHFINRYRILINKGHFLFTEHQKFWKFIKNPSQKVKKCEIFSRVWKNFRRFSEISEISKIAKISIENPIENFWNIGNFSGENPKIFEFFSKSGKYFTFFHFLRWIFYGFSKFLMFWKEEMPFVNSNSISIYEIWSQQKFWHFYKSCNTYCALPNN